jgi:undecaprenyl-diphosphatase
MTIFQAIVLGIVQGLTEFLPISSSAHLVLVPDLLGWEFPAEAAFVFNVLVQVATLFAVIVYFWVDVVDILKSVFTGLLQGKPFADSKARLGWMIFLATIPAAVIGVFIKESVERVFDSPLATALFLLVTAGLLLVAEMIGKRQKNILEKEISWKDAIWIGLFQAVAIFPGVSRSGATITGGMLRGLQRPAAARFSFLMSIPVMLAAGFLVTLDLFKLPAFGALLPNFIPGFIASAITGYLSIRWLLNYLVHHSLVVFSIYCTVLSISVLLLHFLS